MRPSTTLPHPTRYVCWVYVTGGDLGTAALGDDSSYSSLAAAWSLQAGLAELVDGVEYAFTGDFEEESGTLVENLPVSTPPFLYVIPTAPHVTSVCALCGTNSTVGKTSVQSSTTRRASERLTRRSSLCTGIEPCRRGGFHFRADGEAGAWRRLPGVGRYGGVLRFGSPGGRAHRRGIRAPDSSRRAR